MEIGGPCGLGISSSVRPSPNFLSIAFILDKDLAYSDCLDRTCSILLGGLGLFRLTLLWSSCRAFECLNLGSHFLVFLLSCCFFSCWRVLKHGFYKMIFSLMGLRFLGWKLFIRCSSFPLLFSLLQTLTRICAWSLLMWLTCQMDLGRSR